MAGSKLKSILFIVQLPPPVHGASIMNNYVINSEVIKNNFNIDVINFQFVKSIKEISKFSFLKIFKAIGYGIKIIEKVFRNRPVLVYFTLSLTGYAFYRDVLYVLLLKLLTKRIVFHLHTKVIKENFHLYFKKWLYSLVFKNINVICLSKSLVPDLLDIYKSKPYIVPNGIQQLSKPLKHPHSVIESVPQILFLSNYIEDKGILVLIEALDILKSRGCDFNARLVGAPADLTTEFVQNIINSKNLSDRTVVTGPLFGDDKIMEFQHANIFVFPTYYRNEAFPLVILEAMQAGIPVVSTSEGGIPDIIIDNETGFIVESKNAQMLADKIAILLNDNDLCIEMGEKGYQRYLNNYTLNHFENNLNMTFQTIIGN
jgi:glycosyltransferase involved in cell wall biosynthesis